MDAIPFLIYGLATWRIAVMFVRESGPFLIFTRIRELTGITHDQDGLVFTVPDKFLAGLLSCVWCSSVWVGGIWTLLWFLIPEISIWMATVFCLSALAILFDRFVNGQNPK